MRRGWHEALQPELAAALPSGATFNFAAVADPSACDPVSGSDALKRLSCEASPLLHSSVPKSREPDA